MFFEGKGVFLYFIIILSSYIVHYLGRLSLALKLTSLKSKTYVFLNIIEKCARLKLTKKVNVIITIIIEYA